MERDEALKLVKQSVKNKNLVKHMLATEAVMGALAERFGEEVRPCGPSPRHRLRRDGQ